MDSVIVQLIVGLILIFFLLSLASSGVQEVIAGAFRIRAKQLSAFLTKTLGPELEDLVYRHPIVRGLSKPAPETKGTLDDPAPPQKERPSYIPKDAFADALHGVLLASTPDETPGPGLGPAGDPLDALADVPAKIDAAINAIPDPGARSLLQHAWANAEKNVDAWKAELEKWFDASMERLSGWYKRYARRAILAIAVVLAFALNADTITFVSTLWRDPAIRATVASQAQNVQSAKCPPQSSSFDCVAQSVQQIKSLSVPIGWPAHPANDPRVPHGSTSNLIWGWLVKFIGLLLTAAAISRGAPFWFDLLNRFSGGSLRAAGTKPTST
jgi:hypothetical protein